MKIFIFSYVSQSYIEIYAITAQSKERAQEIAKEKYDYNPNFIRIQEIETTVENILDIIDYDLPEYEG